MSGMVHEKQKSTTVEWYTPKWLFDVLGVRFSVDVSSPGQAVVPWVPADRHIVELEDGLVVDWPDGPVWMNHPYGKNDAEWVTKFVRHGSGMGVVHARTDNDAVQHLMKNCTVMFTKRINFVDASGNPPMKLNKDGKLVKSSPGCGQMLYAMGKEFERALIRAQSDPRLRGVVMCALLPGEKAVL